MKITDVKGLGIEELAAQQVEKVKTSEGRARMEESDGGVDVIHLSPQSRLMQKAGEVVYQTPEVRPEKVAAVQEAVEQGTYQVDTKKVANKVIANAILEK